jgi:hypothetical protein
MSANTAAPTRPARSWLLRGVSFGLAAALAIEGGRVLLGRNLHVVVPGRVLRSAQQGETALERLVRSHGVRTVVNLRGCNVHQPWYAGECRATHTTGVNQEDIWFSAGRLPPAPEVRQLIEIFDRGEPPFLLHCRRGADRTGLAAAIALLSQTDASLDDARGQLHWRYGHVALGRPAYLDQFLDEYAAWLGAGQLEHSRQNFRRWVDDGYRPCGYACRIDVLDRPSHLPRGKPYGLLLRAHNTGTAAWPLRAATNAGLHLVYVLRDHRGEVLAAERAGLMDAEVAPGTSIDLTLALPPLPGPGPYRLLIDVADEKHLWFFQTGAEPWEWEFTVRDEVPAAAGQPVAPGLARLAD